MFWMSMPIIWGGVHPTLYPEQVARADYVDFAVVGEGEGSMVELLSVIESGEEAKGVPLSGRDLIDIDEVPSPDFSILEGVRAIGGLAEVGRGIRTGLPLLESRGCAYACKFCINSITREKSRVRRSDLVIRDIEELLKAGVSEIRFFDEDFFVDRKRLLGFLDGIEDRGLEFKWVANARADYFKESYLNSSLLERMKQDGCQLLEVGLESGSQRVLDMMGKGITVGDSLNTARLLSKVGIGAGFTFMVGLPGETMDEARQTLRFVSRIAGMGGGIRIRGVFIYRPYAGSEFYERCLRLGMKPTASLKGWVSNPYMSDMGVGINPKDYSLFPWVEYPMRSLVKLSFYGWMAGIQLKWRWLTWIARRIGILRCRHSWVRCPVEIWLFLLLRRLGITRRLAGGVF